MLFADVSGFTALSETLDPEAMQLVMRDTMSLLAECVQAEGGTLEKFIGDALCAIFGAPVAHVDEPERAARACLAMHEAPRRAGRSRPGSPAARRCTSASTPARSSPARSVTARQFGVMGDTINTAARLMGLAGDAETFVSADHRPPPPALVPARGRRPPRGEGQGRAAGRVASSLGALSEAEHDASSGASGRRCVGRDAELDTLAPRWRRAPPTATASW